MKERLYFSMLLTFTCVVMAATRTNDRTYRKRDIKVKLGTHECISNCSHMSAKNDKYLSCSVGECVSLKIANLTTQSSELFKDGVHFERYSDEKERRNKLALHIKWSPVDNISLQHTKGYLINITDGLSSYSTCYDITTLMVFSDNGHDVFYNDCFGKVKGTLVRPGTTITVHITALPMWEHDHNNGRVTATIQVPDCTNEELHTLQECETTGGRPTTQSCKEDCNTFSMVGSTSYPISCTISKRNFRSLSGPESCDEVNKTITGTPSQPKHIPKEQEWYKYRDPGSDDVKIALNFSWMPSPDSSIENLVGYYLEVTPTSRSDLTNFNKCFSVHTLLSENKHRNAEFFYDCYGRSGSSTVEPSHKYQIHIQSQPTSSDNKAVFDISLPSCADPAMQDVTYCIKENNKTLSGKVEKIFCNNRSMKFAYNVSPEYGSTADIIFCERGVNIQSCKVPLLRSENVQPSGTLYNFSLASSANLSIKYSILVYGTDYPGTRAMDYPDFSVCVAQKPNISDSTIMIVVILVLGILCVVGLIFLAIFCCRKRCNLKIFKKCYESQQEVSHNPVEDPGTGKGPVLLMPILNGVPPPEPAAVIPSKVRVYVIFVDDHTTHKEVVHWFCCYLKYDLGLDVRLNIWEDLKVAVNPVEYMDLNLRAADKVVVICSEGSRHCLDEKDYDGNLFTPVVRNICNQAFIGKNPGKFLVGYFDYSQEKHVPELLHDQCLMYFSLFKVMKQFEQFYFRLVGIEQYQEGGIQRIEKIAFDRYHDPTLTTCGSMLKKCIDKMSAFVQKNPTWYNDRHGDGMAGPNLPPEPSSRPPDASYIPQEDQSIIEVPVEHASIIHLQTIPPPQLANGGPKGARPKVKSDGPSSVHQSQNRVPPLMNPPRPATNRRPYEHIPSITSESTDSSFMIPDTETEDLSSFSPSGARSPSQHAMPKSQELQRPPVMNSFSFNHSYHPESFNQSDFPTLDFDSSIDSRLLTGLPSNETQITRLGLTDSMEQLRATESALLMPNFIGTQTDEEAQSSAPVSPESGVFTLANIDEGDVDIEDQFKSINQSDFVV